VLGNLQLAMDGLDLGVHPPGDELRESLKDALEASQRVESIVRDLRLFSRAEDERSSAVEVESVLESTLRLARNEIRHRARLVKDYRAKAKVRCNESRLGQVFLNLLVNAAQAIPEGRATSNEIRLATYQDAAGRVVVEISDTGSGIPEALRAHLFTPFVTTKPVGVGTGLGLAICQRIVTGFGGEISFESQVGRGTLFRVVLPADTAPVLESTFVPHVGAATRRGRIAMIDDELVLGTLVKKALSREHDVVCFADATSALEQFAIDPEFDLILCDLMMPVVTGVELHDRLVLTHPELAERIVFLTGGAFTPEARAFLERVAKPCLSKPFGIGGLRALVNERIG
jgi:CheY-like chemotaxis protein/two-component sensor histidine kinase